MKWFFLILLGMLAIGVEMLIVGGAATSHRLSADRVAGAVAFAIFCLSLFAYWLASYALKGAAQDWGSDIAHAMLTLSIGAFFILLGTDILITNSCVYSLPASGTFEKWEVEFAAVMSYLQEAGSCSVAGSLFVLLGSGFIWPTLKLISGVTVKRTRRTLL
jgi:hypothetical protein